MADSFTDLLLLRQQESGSNSTTWGTLLNATVNMVEEAIAGRAAVTHDNTANYSLTTANDSTAEFRNAILNIGGALTAARNTVCPTSSKVYIAKNATTGGYATTLKTTAGTGISIPNGKTMLLFCDGTNVVEGIDYITTLQVGTLTLTNPIGPASGGTGVANNAASTITISGAYALTLTLSNTTSVTLPTTGTLATLAGTEELDNKTLDSSVGKGTWTASGTWTLPAVTLGGAVTVPTGVTVTGAGTAAITGFTSVSATTLAGTLSTATQNSVTTMAGLVTVGTLNSGSITSGFGSIDVGADAISGGAGTFTTGAFTQTVSFTDSDVAHPITAFYPASTYAAIDPNSGTVGGLKLTGITDADSANVEPVLIRGFFGATDPNDATAAIRLYAAKSDGANSIVALGNAEMAFQVTNVSTSLLSLLGNGALTVGSLSTGSGAISGGAISGTTLTAGTVGGTLGSLALNGTTSGTATMTVDATVTKVTLDKTLDVTTPTTQTFRMGGASVLQHTSATGAVVIDASGGGVTFAASAAVTTNFDLIEMTAPAGVANTARLFAVDNGSGKTVLKVIFGSGSAVQIAIEP